MPKCSKIPQFFNNVEKPLIQCAPKKMSYQINPNQNWVLWGQIFPLTRLGSSWSCLVLVKNDQKNIFQKQGVPTTGDLARALWFNQHTINLFFGTHCITWLICPTWKQHRESLGEREPPNREVSTRKAISPHQALFAPKVAKDKWIFCFFLTRKICDLKFSSYHSHFSLVSKMVTLGGHGWSEQFSN